MKTTLTQVTRQDKESPKGPYVRIMIKTQEHGDKLLSGFGNAYNDQWKKGDTVNIEVKEVVKGDITYLNFEAVKPVKTDVKENPAVLNKLAELEQLIVGIKITQERMVDMLLEEKNIQSQNENPLYEQ